MKSGGDGELQRAAVAAESGGGREESEMDGGALVVTVLGAVLDREVHVHVHAAATWTSWVLIVRQLRSTTGSKLIAIANNLLQERN